jgi:hypothetical protein
LFEEVMLSHITDSFFGNHDIRVPFHYLLAHICHFVYFLLESVGHVAFL